MADYYSVTFKASFCVLADSQEEAEEIARMMCPDEGEFPIRANPQIDAYLAPNQSDDIKTYAVNR